MDGANLQYIFISFTRFFSIFRTISLVFHIIIPFLFTFSTIYIISFHFLCKHMFFITVEKHFSRLHKTDVLHYINAGIIDIFLLLHLYKSDATIQPSSVKCLSTNESSPNVFAFIPPDKRG